MIRRKLAVAVLLGWCIGSVVPVHASLVGDEILGSVTDLVPFSDPAATVTLDSLPEYETSFDVLDGGGSYVYSLGFGFQFTEDQFMVDIYSLDKSGIVEIPSFSATFSDLDWVGMPSAVLTGMDLVTDIPGVLGNQFGEGVTWSFNENSFTVNFEAYTTDEFRQVVFDLEHGDGAPVVPVPPAAALAFVGMAGVGIRRWVA